MKTANKKQLRQFGAVVPGYPVGAGVALILRGDLEKVKAAAAAAGFSAEALRGVGFDYNAGGSLYIFRSYLDRSRRYCYHIGGGAYWSRHEFRRHFYGSGALFSHCWRRFLKSGGAGCFPEVAETLAAFAAEAVNNEKSPFYIYG